MRHILDLEIKENYDVDIRDKDGNPLKDMQGRPVQDENGRRLTDGQGNPLEPKDFDYEFYGDVGSETDETGEFHFTLNGVDYYTKKAERHIITIKMKNDWQVSVKENGQDVSDPKFTLWKKMDEDDYTCIMLLGLRYCF